MAEQVSTPTTSRVNKRDLSSPEDLLDTKKHRIYDGKSTDVTEVVESSSSYAIMQNLSLDDSAIKSIAAALKETIKSEVQTEINVIINNTVSNIVEGVLKGLQTQINDLTQENHELRSINESLNNRVQSLEIAADAAEQYSRRNCVRVSGVPESSDEFTDNLVLGIADAIGININMEEIDRSHRIGKPRPNSKRRDIIVQFSTYRSRQKLYLNRTKLKSSGHEGVYVNEDLTKHRSDLLFRARQMVKARILAGSWSSDGVVLIKAHKDNKMSVHRILTVEDLDAFKNYTAPVP